MATFASGATSAYNKPFEREDGRQIANEKLKQMKVIAGSEGLFEYVTSVVPPIDLERPDEEEMGTTINARAIHDAKDKKALDQMKAKSKVMTYYRKEIISPAAWTLMLQFTGTDESRALLTPRDIVQKFALTFCVLGAADIMQTQIDLQIPFALGTSVVDFVSKHDSTRTMYETSGAGTGQKEQVNCLKLALRNLFDDNYEAKSQIESEFAPLIDAPNAFLRYVSILLRRESAGQFKNQQDPTRFPQAKINHVKDGSSKPYVGPKNPWSLENCQKMQLKYASCSLESDCPVHTQPDKSGRRHKWGVCTFKTGKRLDGK